MAQVRAVFRAHARALAGESGARPKKRRGTLKELQSSIGAAGGRVIDLRRHRDRKGA